MLWPVYATRDSGVTADYNHQLSVVALREYFKVLPGGEEDWWEAVRTMYGFLYRRALEGRKQSVFLDKTPRYYFIIPELLRIFPESRQLLLLRNPVAVLSSIEKTWCEGDWHALRGFKHDLFLAPQRMAKACAQPGPTQKVVRYEDIVQSTDAVLKDIFHWLGLAEGNVQGMTAQQTPTTEKWKFGDQGLAYAREGAVAQRAADWTTRLADPQFWRCARDYVDRLGAETLGGLGYSMELFDRVLLSNRPTKVQLWRTKSLTVLLEEKWRPPIPRRTQAEPR